MIAITNPPFWGMPRDLHALIINLSDQAALGAPSARLAGQRRIGRVGAEGAQNRSGWTSKVHSRFASQRSGQHRLGEVHPSERRADHLRLSRSAGEREAEGPLTQRAKMC